MKWSKKVKYNKYYNVGVLNKILKNKFLFCVILD